eukprot:m.44797 g.44797  ORF g.44797 m.44797 type:complete len:323 (+) comp14594_c0_seq1:106-1074(+)
MLKKYKNAQELVKKNKDALDKIDDGKKTQEELTRHLQVLKQILCGTGEAEPSEDLLNQISTEAYSCDLLRAMVVKLALVDFESKKDVVSVFSRLVRREVGGRMPTVEYIGENSDILVELLNGYKNSDVALHSGQMLRECIKQEPLAKIVLHREEFYDLFAYVQVSTFDIASDAFTTFKDLLTKHKILCADFLEKNYDRLFSRYVELLTSENYVTKRQSLKLLGELLLDRANFTIMTRYISSPDNLKLMMNMLKDKSRNIQFEAFHVFKVFVANPNKTQPIMEILLKNKDKLVEYLSKFHNDREDEQFSDEKQYLIKQIKELK